MYFKRLDLITIVILIFSLILGILYYQLYRIGKDTAAYQEYRELIEQLTITDLEIDEIYEQELTYINFDRLNARFEAFNFLLDRLKDSRFDHLFDDKVSSLLGNIESDFNTKHLLGEDFKSTNSSMLNSVHYTYDLQKLLLNDPSVDPETKDLLNDTFFSLVQMLIRLEIDQNTMDRVFNRLKQIDSQDPHLLDYVRHTKLVLSKMAELTQSLKEATSVPMQKNIATLIEQINNTHAKNLFTQKMIVSLFFLSSFLFIVLLLISYRRSQQTFLELSAFKYAVENSDNSIVMTDPDRHIVYVNDVFEKDSGYSREEAMGQNPNVLKSGLMDENFYKELNAILDRGEKWEGEFINKRKDGSLFYEKASIVPVFVDDILVNYLAIKLDITDYVEQKQQLQQSAAVFEHTDEGIMITNAEGTIISVNKALMEMTGYQEEELIGQKPNILKSGEQDNYFYKMMWSNIAEHGVWKGKLYDRTKSGALIPTWLTVSTVENTQGEITNYIAIHTDLKQIISTQEQIDFLAHHDSLTRLPNRKKFEDHLIHVLNVAKRNATAVAVLFIDLDRFKVINDTLGHHIGDIMLQTVADRIKGTLRETDMFARIGGDEFVVILETMQTKSDPAYVSGKILDAVKEPIEIDSHILHTTASIGISLFPDDGTDMYTIIKHADSAMYYAKDLGKNNYQYYTEQLSVDIHNRLAIEQAMQTALENGEFFLHFQPQYDLQTRKIVAAEALLRWQNPTLGSISPAEFIPIAEETGLILPIGEFVFREACKTFTSWQKLCIGIKTIAVNVSSVQFTQTDLLETFQMITLETGISPENIEIEITERYILEYTTGNMTILDDFRKLGFKISIDDFGTGYSSMSYLKKLPLDTIKIDKSFIDEIPDDSNDMEITKAIIALSTSLGYSNVAEGIETQAQEEFLKEHGCHIGQGYLFQRPVGNEEFIEFCQSNGQASL